VVDKSAIGAITLGMDFMFIIKLDKGQKDQIHHMADISHNENKDTVCNSEKVIFARLVATGESRECTRKTLEALTSSDSFFSFTV
jgi:hypothetical protein